MPPEEQLTESTTATIEQPSIQAEPHDGEGSSDTAVDWAEVSDDTEGNDPDFTGGAAEDGDAVGAEPAAPTEEDVAKGAGTTEEEKTAQVASEQPAVKVEPAPIPTVAPTVSKQLTAEEFAAEETRIFGELEKLYTMSEEEAQNFLTEPELVLPKTAARLHMAITKDVIGGIHSVLPGIIQAHMNNTGVEQKARDSFYSVNPDLNDPKYEEYIFRVGKMFREVDPNAPSDVAAVRIGDMVRQALGLPGRQAEGSATPAATVQSASTVAPKPFMPARGGGAAPVKEANPWVDIAGDDGLD